jgi:CRISPR-associated protein (TIGR03986 family)
MTPKQLSSIPNNRAAIAPYNFIELPERVVPAPQHEGNHSNYTGHTGVIRCTLTTETPIYTRAALPPDLAAAIEGKHWSELTESQRNAYAAFFHHGDGRPRIPGSSLRGMLRSLVEIGGYGKVERVLSKETRYSFRAVGLSAKNDSLAKEYYRQLGANGNHVKAGYFCKQGDRWFIKPAELINGRQFGWVHRNDVHQVGIAIPGFDDPAYSVQWQTMYFRDFRSHPKLPAKKIATDITTEPQPNLLKGAIVASGNMLETDGTEMSPRRYYCVVSPVDETKPLLSIDPEVLADFKSTLSKFAEDEGNIIDGRPVFFVQSAAGMVTAFGHTPNFRIPYRRENEIRAARVHDLLPIALTDETTQDIVDALFGQIGKISRAGRVFFADGLLTKEQASLPAISPHILTSPRPQNIGLYLVQQKNQANKAETLAHYASKPTETQIRGHKLYWHKRGTTRARIEQSDKVAINRAKTQYTIIRPLDTGTEFSFDIRFESLGDIELGALIWALSLGTGSTRLKLGMGKPLGMGSVKVTVDEVMLSDREQRYTTLFDSDGWGMGERAASETERTNWIGAFQTYVLEQLELSGEFDQLARIAQLKAMLSWEGAPPAEKTRYMEIERPIRGGSIKAAERDANEARRNGRSTVNEYKTRPVLPTPLDVLGRGDEDSKLLRPTPPDTTVPGTVLGTTDSSSPPSPQTKKQHPQIGRIYHQWLIEDIDAQGVWLTVPRELQEFAFATVPIDQMQGKQPKLKEKINVEVIKVQKTNEGMVLICKRLLSKREQAEAGAAKS